MGRWKGLRRRGIAGLLALVLGAGAFLVVPGPRRALAGKCGPNSGNVCAHASACVGFWIFKSCTETWKYYERALEVVK